MNIIKWILDLFKSIFNIFTTKQNEIITAAIEVKATVDEIDYVVQKYEEINTEN